MLFRSIQELHEEIVKISDETKQLSEIELAKATDSLNSRIRFSKRSAKELWMRRNQYTGDNLDVDDVKLSDDQHSRRVNDNKSKQKLPVKDQEDFVKGEIVFIISDKDKTKKREPYLVTEVKSSEVQVVKLKRGSKGVRYNVKKENLYKANEKLSKKIIHSFQDSSQSEDEADKEKELEADHFRNKTECLFCKRANYLDHFHSIESCSRFQTKQQKPFNITPVTDSDNDQSITEQSDEESSALEDEISLNDDVEDEISLNDEDGLENMESPNTTGDTDEDSL